MQLRELILAIKKEKQESIFQTRFRACLKNHSCNLHAPLCGIFHPNSVAVARYGALIRVKSPTNCDAHLAESLFQTRSRPHPFKEQENRNGKNRFCAHLGGRQ